MVFLHPSGVIFLRLKVVGTVGLMESVKTPIPDLCLVLTADVYILVAKNYRQLIWEPLEWRVTT